MFRPTSLSTRLFTSPLLILLLGIYLATPAQEGKSLYKQIQAFTLSGAKTDVQSLSLKRDRVEMSFTGTFYFTPPIDGKVYGAVFIGQGTFKADAPATDFERANLKRLIGVEDTVESDFKTAVLRFTDETMDIIGVNRGEGAVPPQAQTLASEIDHRMLKETGANLSARITSSVLNGEKPGFFFGTFDGGRRNRFTYILDQQKRIPTDYFNLNAGESGIVFKYKSETYDNDIWLAFYTLDEYASGTGSYSDLNDLVDIEHYDMDIDLKQPKKKLGLHTKMTMKSLVKDLKMVTFTIGSNLGEYEDARLKKQMHLRSATMGGTSLEWMQEDWESGFSVIFPAPMAAGQSIDIDLDLDGDFLRQPEEHSDCSYPRSNDSWYPQHGYLDRATFDFKFTHPKKFKVASTGTRTSEEPDAADKDLMVTKYVMNVPVANQTFALGPFIRHTDTIKWENGDKPTPLEFNSLSGSELALKEDFILAELNNTIRNFQALFGKYPYETYGAVYHPYSFGQGFATMLTIPNTDRATKYTYSFIAHETSHQWWGNIIGWRSYRDQWLSEGFAEYSGMIYTGLRDGPKSEAKLIDLARQSLRDPPYTELGLPGKGKLVEVGPLILGSRLETRKTQGAYTTLVYNKGALVLRMIHSLFTDPATGNGDAFFNMMKDFVNQYRNKVASTDDFRRVANEHFARSPIGMRFKLNNLDWFFQEWVYQTALPSYRMDYHIQTFPDGTGAVAGNVYQTNAPDNWFMPLPVILKFPGNKFAFAVVIARGPKMAFQMKLPMPPTGMELDPQHWILSEKTESN
jgi:hypothetical protein